MAFATMVVPIVIIYSTSGLDVNPYNPDFHPIMEPLLFLTYLVFMPLAVIVKILLLKNEQIMKKNEHPQLEPQRPVHHHAVNHWKEVDNNPGECRIIFTG